MGEVADVCVVGGGPAGLTVALTLTAAGRRVVLVDSGGVRPSRTAQELNDGDHEGETYSGLARTRSRGLGGTANIWDVSVHGEPAAKYVPLSRGDVAGWPIGWEELEACYRDAQPLCGLGPFEYSADYWATPGREPFQVPGTGLTSGVYQFGYARRFTAELVAELRAAPSATVVTATVVELRLDGSRRRVVGVRAVDEQGRPIDVWGRIAVLACGAVENARLLLLAGGGGIDTSKWLGRCFMEHARDFSLALVPGSPDLFARATFYDLWTSADGSLVGGRLAVTDEARDAFDLPSCSLTLVPRQRASRGRRLVARAPGPVRRVARLAPDGRYGWSRVRFPAFDRFDLVLNLEHRPDPYNRITLGARRDRFGNPLPRLLLRWTDAEQARLERLRELVRKWSGAAGLGRLETTPGARPDLSAAHHAGTTRMAADPEDGVVDPHGRVFAVDNLYVAGASVFPSAGFANPTLTVVAMAARLGRHLDARLGSS